MGLLDKAGSSGAKSDEKPKAKAVAKAKPVAKAKAKPVAKAKAKPVAKADPVEVQSVEKVVQPKPKKEKKVRTPRPSGLPDGFELASKLDRTMSWFVNFGWNFGVLLAAIFMMTSDTGVVTTILLIVSLVMIFLNVIVLPFKTGRNLGQFVSRVKFVNYNGDKSTPFQGMLSNSVGILSLFGILFITISTSKLGDDDAGAMPIVLTVLGAIFVILWIVNLQFSRASNYNQGLYDVMFGAYLVKHVPTAEEKSSGFWAKFENMGDYGDKFAARREAKRIEKEQKALEDAENSETSEDSGKSDKDESKSETKAKAKAKSKAKAKAKAKPKAKK